ncbi:MAG: proprotein convertase P-domain-containing protein [Bacteroidota bacterium]
MKSQVFRLWLVSIWCGIAGVVGTAQVVLTNPSNCQMEIPLTDNNCPENSPFFNPDLFDIIVNTAPGSELGIDVYLEEVQLIIEHEWIGDLDIVLLSPGGTAVALTLDNGGSEDSYGSPTDMACDTATVFSMTSCISINDGEPPYIDGPYLPEESLWNFNDGSDPNGFWRLQICDRVGSHSGTLDYINLVFAPLVCLPLEDLTLVNVDSTTAILDWAPVGECGTAIIEYGPPGFVPGVDSLPGEGQVVFGACPPFQLDSLEALFAYDVYVRKACESGFSVNSCPVSFETGCDPPPMTLRSHFDAETMDCVAGCGLACDLNGIWQNSTEDDFDWFPFSGSTGTQNTGPSSDISGSGNYLYAEVTGSACNNGTQAYLVSDCIELDKRGSVECHLSFNYHLFGDDIGSLSLEVQDISNMWTTLWSVSGNQGNAWQKAYVSLDGYADGAILQFRFVATSGAGPEGDMAIDEVVFYGSQLVGAPDQEYFADMDGDGFGDENVRMFSCFPVPPAGFVTDSTDCDDTRMLVNPAMEEIFCDNIDNNCNGLQDDDILPQLEVVGDTVCAGELATLSTMSVTGRVIFWFSTPDGLFDFVDFGETVEVTPPPNNTPLPISVFYYAEENGGANCGTVPRTPVEVIILPNPNLSVLVQPETCPNQPFDLNSIQINDANLTGGTPVFYSSGSYAEADRLDNTIVTLSNTTTFFYEVINNFGCVGRSSVEVVVKPGPDLSFSSGDSLTLCPLVTESVSVMPNGGTAPFEYFWSTGESTAAINVTAGVQPGQVDTYLVTVTDGEGCFSVDSVQVQTANNIVSFTRQVEAVSDCGIADGAINIMPQGAPPFSYTWAGSDGSTGFGGPVNTAINIGGLAEGSYRVTITDSSVEMCPVVAQAVIQGPTLSISEVLASDVSCNGGNDGAACLIVSGENPQYLWETGDSTSCVDSLTAGIYRVTVSNPSCELAIDVEIAEPDALIVSGLVEDERCVDGMDGTVSGLVFGGTPDYTYEWSTGSSATDISGLSSGIFGLTVSDELGCIDSARFEVGVPDTLVLVLDSLRNMSCTGFTDGYLQVSALGGTPPYRFDWSTGVAAPAIGNLSEGTFSVSVTDFNGCTELASYSIIEPIPLVLDDILMIDPSCVGVKDGSLEVLVSGGTPPYAYDWSNGSNTALNENIQSGDYSVVISDKAGCTLDTLFIELTSVSSIDWNALLEDPSCIGAGDGSIRLSPAGVPPFDFSWTSGVADTLSNLMERDTGQYGVTLIDAEGCIYDTIFTLSAPQVFDLTFELIQPLCAGESNGAIAATVLTGGQLPYTYQWSNGVQTEDLFGAGDGGYVLQVVDDNNCTYFSDSLYLASPRGLDIKVDALGEIVCSDDSTAFIELTLEGGILPYRYTWTGVNSSNDDVFNLPAGSYQLEVLDANDCPIDTTFFFDEPEKIKVDWTLETGELCEPSLLSEICPVVSGGVPPYTFTLEGAPESTEASPCFLDLLPGEYVLVVEDSRGCVAQSNTIKIDEAGPVVQLDTFFTTNLTCFDDPTGTMTAEVSGGSGFYQFHFTPTVILDTLSDAITIEELAAGTDFSVTITDLVTGCSVESSELVITQPTPISVARDEVIEPSCAGDATGIILTTAFGGTPPYAFTWRNAAMEVVGNMEDLAGVPAGTYTLEVVDTNGCVGLSVPTTIEDAAETISPTFFVEAPLCEGDSTGFVTLTIEGGTPPFQVLWSNGDTTLTADSLATGFYGVTILDANFCSFSATAIEVEASQVSITIEEMVEPVSCFAFVDGSISVSPSGGMMPYTYDWFFDGSPLVGAAGAFQEELQAGEYQVLVTDLMGCTQLQSITLSQPDSLSVELELIFPNPPGETGRIDASPMGGTPDYTYLWNTGDMTASIENIIVGATYIVTVTDANGCAAENRVEVSNASLPVELTYWNLFPNPFQDQLVVELESDRVRYVELLLFNTLGQQLLVQPLDLAKAKRWELSLQGLPAGTYWVGLRQNGALIGGRKVVKME